MKSCFDAVTNSYDRHTKKLLRNVTVGQLVDGLNDFYSDYKHRRITTNDSFWIVTKGIAGTPKEESTKLLRTIEKTQSNRGDRE